MIRCDHNFNAWNWDKAPRLCVQEATKYFIYRGKPVARCDPHGISWAEYYACCEITQEEYLVLQVMVS